MRPLLLLLAAAAAGCTAAFEPAARDVWPPTPEHVSHAGAYLQVAGVGKPDPAARSKTQRRSTSRDAAILDARATLLAYIKELRRPDGVTVGERASVDPEAQKRLDAASPAIDVVETRWDDDDTAAVVLRVEKAPILRALGLAAEPEP